jgi:hypothetical protein
MSMTTDHRRQNTTYYPSLDLIAFGISGVTWGAPLEYLVPPAKAPSPSDLRELQL